MPPILGVPSDQWIKIVEYILILGVVWILIHAILKMVSRLFLFGCGAIVALGLVLFALRAIRGY